ncbi:putative transcription factor GRF family [Helianthus annuus]|nr:putative transcription factor GRF family [Helianthus annuus]
MSSSSNSSWSVNRTPKLFKVDLDGNLYCHHEVVVVLRIAGPKSVRHGDQFYGCPQWPLSDCKFFMWKQDFDKFFEAHSTCSSSPVSYQELKNENLELQNKLLLEENRMAEKTNSWQKVHVEATISVYYVFVIALWMYILNKVI